MIDEGTRILDRATRLRRPGPYQLQAAIAEGPAAGLLRKRPREGGAE
jgi:predicted RNA polymerase sigma factor